MSEVGGIGRHSSVSISDTQSEPGKEVEKKKGEPTKAQKFGTSMKNDMRFLGTFLGQPFFSTGNLIKSFSRGSEQLQNKKQLLEGFDNKIKNLKYEREDKVSELSTHVDSLFESEEGQGLGKDQQKIVRDYFQQRLETGKNEEQLPPPMFMRTLLNKNRSINSDITTSLTNINTLKDKIESTRSEQHKLEKLTPGKLAGKLVRAGLLGIASPFLSVMGTVLVAPALPIWTGLALVRAGQHSEGHKVFGNPNLYGGERVGNKMKDLV